MSFDIDPVYVFYALAAGSVVLVVEAIYLLFFSKASYRNNINRRLKLMDGQPDRESVLIQIRRERGLTSGGHYRLPILSFNKLLLQSGLSIGISRLVMLFLIAVCAVFVVMAVTRESLLDAAVIAIAAGAVIPYFGLHFLRKRRQKKFAARFPDALDIIVRSLRAGHPVPVAISMVSRELPDPMGSEFGIVSDEITYGADLETAMRNLYFRVGQDDLPLFVTAVAIQTSTGGNLSEILENLSGVIRQRFKMRRKIVALASEGKFSAIFLSGLPVAIFFLLRLMAPEFYDSVWDKDLTKMGLAVAAAWLLTGNFIMFRMVNFKI
jgi:tight adherence protein B